MHYTIMLLAQIWLIYPLSHVYAESELEELTEQAQAEKFTNLAWIKVGPGASNHHSWTLFLFMFNLWFLDVH
jgi:hypothetical protein